MPSSPRRATARASFQLETCTPIPPWTILGRSAAISTAADARRLARVTLAHAGATTLATLVAPLPAKLPPSAEEKLGSWPSEEIEKASVMVAVSQTMHQLKRCRIGGTGLQGTP